jgi:hypothetical protein
VLSLTPVRMVTFYLRKALIDAYAIDKDDPGDSVQTFRVCIAADFYFQNLPACSCVEGAVRLNSKRRKAIWIHPSAMRVDQTAISCNEKGTRMWICRYLIVLVP